MNDPKKKMIQIPSSTTLLAEVVLKGDVEGSATTAVDPRCMRLWQDPAATSGYFHKWNS